jgi:hypothetical protein
VQESLRLFLPVAPIYGLGLAMAVNWSSNCSAPYVAVASGPKTETLFLELELFVLEPLPFPPSIHANAATARIKQIKIIRTISLVISRFSLKHSFCSIRQRRSTGYVAAQAS